MDRATGTQHETGVRIDVSTACLEGDLVVPEGARAVVLFAHGSGSSRHSPRNRVVAEALQAAGLGTLLLDLMTREEETLDTWTGHLRFDIDLLEDRVIEASDWLAEHPTTSGLALGYFGASTGAAAALAAAADRPGAAAVISRGGRPDLAGNALTRVHSPTLLIVGGNDDLVLRLNRQALAKIPAEKRLEIVSGATHLFEEPGALERVAELARDWFIGHTTPTIERAARRATSR